MKLDEGNSQCIYCGKIAKYNTTYKKAHLSNERDAKLNRAAYCESVPIDISTPIVEAFANNEMKENAKRKFVEAKEAESDAALISKSVDVQIKKKVQITFQQSLELRKCVMADEATKILGH